MRERIRFVYDGAIREVGDIDPTTTVLEYLRTVERRTGTKEGCAEGDCGACTVVLGVPEGDSVSYRPVNACILFFPALDGKQLITVENLRRSDRELHPAQRAMVDCHGSQCGFCTPGFVMSLFALYHDGAAPERSKINDSLAGNLCRCTGYHSIAQAAWRMFDSAFGDQFAAAQPDTLALLEQIRPSEALHLSHRGKEYFAPHTSEELAELLVRHPDAHILAGGTDVGLWVTKELREPEKLVYVGQVGDLDYVRVEQNQIEIGAAASLQRVMTVMSDIYPDFGEVLRRFGSLQIRNSGTLVGNVANASPIGDSIPPLIALGALVTLRKGERRRELPLDQLFLGYRQISREPGEFIEKVIVPRKQCRFAAYKISKRFDQDISTVLGSFCLELDRDRVKDVRVCYGGLSATPQRAHQCEEALRGSPWDEHTVGLGAKALDRDYSPITDFRGSAEYRRLVARNLLRKFYLETEGTHLTRVLEFQGVGDA